MKNIIIIVLLLVVTTGIIMLLLKGSVHQLDGRADPQTEQNANGNNKTHTAATVKPDKEQAIRENLEKAVQDAINHDIRKAISDELSRHKQPTDSPNEKK